MAFFGEDPYGNYTSQSMSVGDFCRQMIDGSIKIPEYQREFVWTTIYKQGYLQTLSQRGPIFGFVMNYNSDDGTYEVIDGQNRGKTIFEFMNDIDIKMHSSSIQNVIHVKTNNSCTRSIIIPEK